MARTAHNRGCCAIQIRRMFPVTITYSDASWLPEESVDSVSSTIQEELEVLKVSYVQSAFQKVSFRNSFFNGQQGRTHLMATVDSGTFFLDVQSRTLRYTLSLRRTLGFSIIAGVLFALVSGAIAVGIIAFLWFFGLNWIITYIRHKRFFNRIIRLLGTTSPDPKGRMMRKDYTVLKGRVFFLLVFVALPILYFFVSSNRANERAAFFSQMSTTNAISRVEIEVSHDGTQKYLTIVDGKTLDSIRVALKEAKRIDINTGGDHPIYAHVKVYSAKEKKELIVQYSKYHGWCLILAYQEYECGFVFDLIRRLAQLDDSATGSAQQELLR
jgi:hypothetical protein